METDPHAFRLTTDWTGSDFTYVMTNGILLGQSASDAGFGAVGSNNNSK